jgi:hypothetical protein
LQILLAIVALDMMLGNLYVEGIIFCCVWIALEFLWVAKKNAVYLYLCTIILCAGIFIFFLVAPAILNIYSCVKYIRDAKALRECGEKAMSETIQDSRILTMIFYSAITAFSILNTIIYEPYSSFMFLYYNPPQYGDIFSDLYLSVVLYTISIVVLIGSISLMIIGGVRKKQKLIKFSIITYVIFAVILLISIRPTFNDIIITIMFVDLPVIFMQISCYRANEEM